MGALLSRLMGLDVTLDFNSRIKTSFVGLFGYAWLAIPILVALMAALFWFYRRDARRLTRRQLLVLWILRICAALMLMLMLLKPVLHITVNEVQLPVVGMFIDESVSMELPDAPGSPLISAQPGAPREERSRLTAARNATLKLKEKLQYTHRVQVFKFSDTMAHVMDMSYKPRENRQSEEQSREENEELKKTLQATGDHTDIGDCLFQAIERFSVGQPSALIVFSDGRRTGGAELSQVANEAALAKIPFHTVTLGTKEPLRDLALLDLVAPSEAALNDVLSMQMTVVNHIRPQLETTLKIYENDELKVEKPVKLKEGQNSVMLAVVPKVEGERLFRIEAEHFPDELTYENNTVQCHVNVVKKTLRVLFMAGVPTIEYHYIVPSLVRDPILEVSCWLQDADVLYLQQGNKPVERLPKTSEDWNEYDVVILYDIDPNKFDNKQEENLQQLVSKGGGALFIAGRTYGMDRLLQVRTDKMNDLLPVDIDKSRPPKYDKHFNKPFRLVRTPEAIRHPVFMLEMDEEMNTKVWDSMPPFFWNSPTLGIKPTAIPLMKKIYDDGSQDDRGDTVMAMQRYNNGVTFFTGINDLWRWRFPYENYDYDRFWNQIVRYLGESRLQGAQKQVILKTDKKQYSPGETVKVLLAVIDPALWKQLQGEQVAVKIKDQAGARYDLSMIRDPRGRQEYRGEYTARRVGNYTAEASHALKAGTSDERKLFDEKQHFDVLLQSLEFVDTTADLDDMAMLAERTGGKAYNQHNMGSLDDLVKEIPEKKQLIPHDTDEEVWDSFLFLLLFLGFVTAEWALRKQWSLL